MELKKDYATTFKRKVEMTLLGVIMALRLAMGMISVMTTVGYTRKVQYSRLQTYSVRAKAQKIFLPPTALQAQVKETYPQRSIGNDAF